MGSMSDCRARSSEIQPQLCHVTFMEINREIISTVILLLLLILEGQLSVTDESMCMSTGQRLRGPSLPR